MADILSSQPGRVAVVSGNGLPLNVSIGNKSINSKIFGNLPSSRWQGFSGNTPGSNGFKAIIQNLGLSGQSGLQVTNSLRDFIHIYVYGERPGALRISGLAFVSACGDANAPSSGFERVVRYYQKFRVSNYPLALRIAIGTQLVFDAFMHGMNVGITSPETSLTQFNLDLITITSQNNLIGDEDS